MPVSYRRRALAVIKTRRARPVTKAPDQPVAPMAENIDMEAAPRHRRLIRGFALLLALLALAAGAKAILYDTLDPDLFWHLRVAGQLSRQTFPHPIVDHLSFASIKTPWTPYSWLADLAIKRIWDWGGYRAAVLLQAIMEAAMVVFIALTALEMSMNRLRRPRYLAAALAAFAGGFLALPYLSFRPVTFALLLLAIMAWLLQRDSRRGGRWRQVWLVIPLTALLANVHLYVVFAPAMVLALLLGAWMEQRRGIGRYGWLLLGTTAASLLTPMLPGDLAAAWHYQFGDAMVNSRVIAEMQPFYHGPLGWASAALVLAILAAAIINRRKLNRGQWLWLLGGLMVMLRLGRFTALFAILAAPTLAVTAGALRDSLLTRRWVQAALSIILILGGMRVARAFPPPAMPLSQWLNRLGLQAPGYPTAAADFVQRHVRPRTHRLICEFNWGSYLEWRLGDADQVLMDGRTQLYSHTFWQALYLGSAAQRKAYLATVTADAAIVPARGSLFRRDLLQLGWTIAWSSPRAQVLLPPA
jgi:hypothetical protein